MPEERNNSTTFLIIVLVVVVLITLSLLGYYLYSRSSTTATLPGFLTKTTQNGSKSSGNSISPGPLAPVNTTVYEGYIQELSQKSNSINGIDYSYVIGLLDKNDNSLPVWITQKEYDGIKVYDSRTGGRTASSLNSMRGGDFIRVTRITPKDGPIDQSSITIELINY